MSGELCLIGAGNRHCGLPKGHEGKCGGPEVGVSHYIELRGIYDGWSVKAMHDGSFVNRWAHDDRRFQPTQDWVVSQFEINGPSPCSEGKVLESSGEGSVLGWERRSRRRHGYWGSLTKLLAHLLGTGVMFSAILILSWGLSYLAHKLNEAHPFPPEIYSFVTKIELWLVYIDVVISAVVLLFGAARFLQEIWEDR